MPLPVSGNYPQQSGNRVPEVWSDTLQPKFYEATALSEIANTDYEGEITAYGDKVHIRTTPEIDTFDYEKNMILPTQNPDSPTTELNIDKGAGFNFATENVDIHMADVDMINDWTTAAVLSLKIRIETAIWADIPSSASAFNVGTTAGKITQGFDMGTAGGALTLNASNILDVLVDAGTILDEQNVPLEDRWMLLSPRFIGYLIKSGLQRANEMGDGQSVLRNGRVGAIANFTIFQSNLLAVSGTEISLLYGQKTALTFASAVAEYKSLDNPDGFGRLHRGLQVYGYEVIKDESLGVIVATK